MKTDYENYLESELAAARRERDTAIESRRAYRREILSQLATECEVGLVDPGVLTRIRDIR